MRGDVTDQNIGTGQHRLGLWVCVLQKRLWEPRIATEFSQSLTKKAENAIDNVRRGDYFIGVVGEMLEAISWALEVVAANEPQSVNSGGGKIIYLK